MQTKTKSVQTGQILFSMGVNQALALIPSFSKVVMNSLSKHTNGDWGDMDQQDIETNNLALIHEGRLLSSYKITDIKDIDQKKLWIITEWDRSVTTILFPNEY
jgi:hypothetical protein